MNLFEKLRAVANKILSDLGIKNPKDLPEHLPMVVQILGQLKKLVDSDAVDAVASIFIGHSQEVLIKEALDRVLIKLTYGTIIAQDVANAKSAVDKLKIFAADLQKYHIEIQHINIGKLAALVAHDLAGGEMSINDSTIAVEQIIKEYATQAA